MTDLIRTVCKKGFITDGSSQVMNPFFVMIAAYK